VDARARNYETIEDLKRSSLDYYATIRSLYRQRRGDDIRNGDESIFAPKPDLSSTPDGPRVRKTEEVSLSQ
jgi:phospholipid-binding lipoprotein MlaA